MSGLFTSGVRPIIDDFLLMEAAKVRDYGDYWSASSAGYCQRKLIFERLGVPTTLPEDARKQRVFSAGHLFHSWIQELTRKAGVSVAQEVELQDEDLMVRGHFDDLILADGKLLLYDYKTVNSRSFMWAKKSGNAMSYYHKMQLGTYMYMLRRHRAGTENKLIYQVEEARILKIEKENLMMMEQQLFWTPELEAEVLDYWRSLNTHWNAKAVPACTCKEQEGGFMAREKFNPFFFEDTPCSIKWLKLKVAEGVVSW